MIKSGLIAAGLLVISACIQSGESSYCGDRDALMESAFRFQFTNNYSGLNNRAAAYFIAIEDDQDPDSEFLERFSGHQPPVRPLSAADRRSDKVADPASGKAALIFRIRKLVYESPTTATITGGYFEGALSASFVTMHAECRGKSWQIEKTRPQKISANVENQRSRSS